MGALRTAVDSTITRPQLDPGPSTDLIPRFSPNDVVAERYRVIRFLGRGGMGEVFEVEDLELGIRVALKTIRAEIASDPGVLERFKRELHLSREISHPHVCRVFDLGTHQPLARPPGPSAPRVHFLTMELLGGETLAERLNRCGSLPPAQAEPLVLQMADGLAAAHAARIVHRDFKCGNVMLVPAREEVRAVVTDFGLARGGTRDGDALTVPSGFMGTPTYMAPEQVEGKEVTAAADVYALGTVMFEMVTGRPPFQGDTPLAAAVKRLREPPPSPRRHLPGLEKRWEATILACLARSPGQRPRSADVAELLRRGPPSRARRWLVAAVGLGLVVAGAVWALPDRSDAPRGRVELGAPVQARSKPAPAPRRSVAIVGFRNLSKDGRAKWLGTALAEMLPTELAAAGRLRAIPGEAVARARLGLSLPDTDAFTRRTLERLRRNLGADLVVLGRYLASPADGGVAVRVDLRVQDAARGTTLTSVTETGTEAAVLDLIARIGRRLRVELGSEPTPGSRPPERLPAPRSTEAARLYAEGLGKLRAFDPLAASRLLERAAAADAQFPLVHAALSDVWKDLGYSGKSTEAARRAYELSTDLPWEQRLTIEAKYRERTAQYDQAIALYRTLRARYPNNLDHGLRLASALAFGGRGREGLRVLAKLRALPPPDGESPSIDLVEAEVAKTLSDFRRRREAGVRAARKGRESGSNLVVAEGRLAEGWATYFLGAPAKAQAAFDEALALARKLGHRRLVSNASFGSGMMKYLRGDVEGGMRLYEESLHLREALGDQHGKSEILGELAFLLLEQGRFIEARSRAGESLRLARLVADERRVGWALFYLGAAHYHLGDLAAARRRFQESRGVYERRGNRYMVAYNESGLAHVSFIEGNLARARRQLEGVVAVFARQGDNPYLTVPLLGLGRVLLAQDQLAGAQQRFEAALRSARKSGMRMPLGEAELALAELALEQGRPADALARAGRAGEIFARQKAPHREVLARTLHSRARRRLGERAAAAREIAGVVERLSEVQSRREPLVVRLEAASTRPPGQAARALRELRAIEEASVRAGFKDLALEVCWRRGRAELAGGLRRKGRRTLAYLSREARALGFLLIARKAQAAVSGGSRRGGPVEASVR